MIPGITAGGSSAGEPPFEYELPVEWVFIAEELSFYDTRYERNSFSDLAGETVTFDPGDFDYIHVATETPGDLSEGTFVLRLNSSEAPFIPLNAFSHVRVYDDEDTLLLTLLTSEATDSGLPSESIDPTYWNWFSTPMDFVFEDGLTYKVILSNG